jgi:hypothetical protein
MKRAFAPTGFRLTLVCMALLLATGLADPSAAGAQKRGPDDIPEQLWETYPLDPTKMDAGAPKTVQPQPAPRGQAETDPVRTPEPSGAQARSSEKSNPGRSLVTRPILGALLGLLVGLLVIATARSGALALTAGYLGRSGSILASPLRAATHAPRYVGRGGALIVSPLWTLPSVLRRIGHRLLWPVRTVASAVTYVVRAIGSAVAMTEQASRTVLQEGRASP